MNTNPTQQELDRAYLEGRQAYHRDVGTHGPTLRQRVVRHSVNPHHHDREAKLHLAWQRGYNQDTRRVIA